jgi:hypothetical protein
MTLNFNDERGKKRFEFCFIGFVLGGSMIQEKKGMQVLRKEVILFEKLEAISEPKPCGKKLPNGEAERQLIGGSIEITPDEYDMLHNYISAAPWQTGSPARDAIETLDWLHASGRTS